MAIRPPIELPNTKVRSTPRASQSSATEAAHDGSFPVLDLTGVASSVADEIHVEQLNVTSKRSKPRLEERMVHLGTVDHQKRRPLDQPLARHRQALAIDVEEHLQAGGKPDEHAESLTWVR